MAYYPFSLHSSAAEDNTVPANQSLLPNPALKSGSSVSSSSTINSSGSVNFGVPVSIPYSGTLTYSYSELTPEERKEYDELREQWNIEVKIAKLAKFKKLPTDLRQFVVNTIYWVEAMRKINNVTVPISERLNELSNRSSFVRLNSSSSLNAIPIYTSNYSAMSESLNIPLPDGISFEDLKNAHIEQTMEEEMLHEK